MNMQVKSPGVIYARVETTDKRDSFSPLFNAINEQKQLQEIRIDLKDIYFLSSETLADFMALKKTASAKKASTVLLNVDESIYRILEMTNMLPHFALERDFSSYSRRELMELFYRQDDAEEVSAYIGSNYSDGFQSLLMDALDSDDSIIQEYAVLTMGRAHDDDLIPLQIGRASCRERVSKLV
jgi:anti-anti-sigma factor